MTRSLRNISLHPMFHPDAYEFLKMALRFTVHNAPRMNSDEPAEQSPPEPGVPDESQHVSGQELLEGIRRYALGQFGLMTTWVFQHWGIDTTEDWGRMVFELIDRGEMYKTEHDQLSDFTDVYSFDRAFDLDYEIDTSPAFSHQAP
ncbi:MAG: Minf_1886 family protein [Planctomycetota bacterium]|nr:Minf_1886 family protein [Planctomycetota bacterium]